MADSNWMWIGDVADLWDDDAVDEQMNATARAYMAANDGEVPVPALVSQDMAQMLGLMVDLSQIADPDMLTGIHVDFDINVDVIEPESESSVPKEKKNEESDAPVSPLHDTTGA